MTEHHSRTEYRTEVQKVELVTVYRDRKDMSYDEAVETLVHAAAVYNLFSVVAVVRDASQQGLGLKFEGQQLMAQNVLRNQERYILKLTLPNAALPMPVTQAFLRPEGNYHYLLLKVVCRWHNPSAEGVSKAGFELADNNEPDVAQFVKEYFGLVDH